MLSGLFLGDPATLLYRGPLGPLSGTGIGFGSLPPDRQCPSMAKAPVGTQIHQPFDIHRHLRAKFTFHGVVTVYQLADIVDLGF